MGFECNRTTILWIKFFLFIIQVDIFHFTKKIYSSPHRSIWQQLCLQSSAAYRRKKSGRSMKILALKRLFTKIPKIHRVLSLYKGRTFFHKETFWINLVFIHSVLPFILVFPHNTVDIDTLLCILPQNADDFRWNFQ